MQSIWNDAKAHGNVSKAWVVGMLARRAPRAATTTTPTRPAGARPAIGRNNNAGNPGSQRDSSNTAVKRQLRTPRPARLLRAGLAAAAGLLATPWALADDGAPTMAPGPAGPVLVLPLQSPPRLEKQPSV